MDHSTLDGNSSSTGNRLPITTSEQEKSPVTAVCATSESSTLSTTQANGPKSLKETLQSSGIPRRTCKLILQSWSLGTQKQYEVYIRQWCKFASKRSCDPLRPLEREVMSFLQRLYDSGLSYSTINTAKSAIQALLSCSSNTLEESPIMERFMKGIAFSRPSRAKYHSTWDPDIVLKYITKLPSNSHLSLKMLTTKLAMLAALVTGQRAQTLHSLDLTSMKMSRDCACFVIDKRIKSTTVRGKPIVVHFPRFRKRDQICVLRCLRSYIERTKQFRKSKNSALFLTTQKPHNPAARDTIRNWIKSLMSNAGIDVSNYTAHSSRAASTSKAAHSLPLNSIMKAAGWSSRSTFAKHYHRPVVDHSSFAEAVLRPTKVSHH